MNKISFSAGYFIAVWTVSALTWYFRNWVFLNVLLLALHVCSVVSLFIILCLEAQLFYSSWISFNLIMFSSASQNSPISFFSFFKFQHRICPISVKKLLFSIIVLLKDAYICWSWLSVAPLAINANIVYVLVKLHCWSTVGYTYNTIVHKVKPNFSWDQTFLGISLLC